MTERADLTIGFDSADSRTWPPNAESWFQVSYTHEAILHRDVDLPPGRSYWYQIPQILLMTLWRPFPSGKFRHQQIQSILTSNSAFFGHIIQFISTFSEVRSVTTLTNFPLTLTSLPANKMKFPPNLRSIRIVSSSTKPFTLPSTTKCQLYDGK